MRAAQLRRKRARDLAFGRWVPPVWDYSVEIASHGWESADSLGGLNLLEALGFLDHRLGHLHNVWVRRIKSGYEVVQPKDPGAWVTSLDLSGRPRLEWVILATVRYQRR